MAILLAANMHLRQSNYEFPRHFSRGLCCDCFFTADDVSDDKESQAQWEVSTMAIRLRVECAATWRLSARGEASGGLRTRLKLVRPSKLLLRITKFPGILVVEYIYIYVVEYTDEPEMEIVFNYE